MSLSPQSPLATNVAHLFESDLRDQQRELLRIIEKSQKEMRALANSGQRNIVDDSCGNASMENMLASLCQHRARLRKVELALKRIFTGGFGICADCGDAVGLKRLQAVPWVTNCIACQERAEQGRVN